MSWSRGWVVDEVQAEDGSEGLCPGFRGIGSEIASGSGLKSRPLGGMESRSRNRVKVRARSLLGFRAGDKAHEKVLPIISRRKREGR